MEREKKHRGDVEKAKRKVENDLKLMQENCEELERIRHDLEESVRRSAYDVSTEGRQHNVFFDMLF